jgi:hypothetical protein
MFLTPSNNDDIYSEKVRRKIWVLQVLSLVVSKRSFNSDSCE